MADGHTGGSFPFKRDVDGVGIVLRLLGHIVVGVKECGLFWWAEGVCFSASCMCFSASCGFQLRLVRNEYNANGMGNVADSFDQIGLQVCPLVVALCELGVEHVDLVSEDN